MVDRPFAALEDADPVPRAALPRRDVRRPRQRPQRPAGGARGVPRGGVRRRRARRARRDRDGAGRACRRRRAARSGRCTSPRAIRSGSSGSPSSRRPSRSPPSTRARRRCATSRVARRRTKAGTSGTATTGSRTTRTSSGSSSRSSSASRTRRSRARTRPLGARHRPADAPRVRSSRPGLQDEDERARAPARIGCPMLVIHGERRRRHPAARRRAARGARRRTLVVLEGSGHMPNARDPVKVNLLLRDFVGRRRRRRAGRAAESRRKRALFVSSPIGLGHAQRDAAIADELRKLHPDLEIDWLAQHPVTAVLEARGERIHPGSAFLANESHHIECESAEHDLHCFQAIRRMDEILLVELHALPRRRARRPLRPLDRRRGVGARLLPAREPRGEARARTSG